MKEKIWIEKLVMLLDIYEEEVVGVHSVWEHITEKDEAWIISKQFWFIKWLVENDKIDLDMVREKLWTPCFTWYKKWEIVAVKDVADYGQVLMLLSISDTPIEDLILYLK